MRPPVLAPHCGGRASAREPTLKSKGSSPSAAGRARDPRLETD
ncbi:hypothetical protein QO011_001855 [Labrys wisconsinensis]|uniref:Uncharacterized protein n=1 Tax=Labrys wisconsinensis TaxID=425677 RepID=A0ABU0J5E5_9HYPH|nr:hypothetical protein [Labrys wisconsinensis]